MSNRAILEEKIYELELKLTFLSSALFAWDLEAVDLSEEELNYMATLLLEIKQEVGTIRELPFS